MEFEVRAGRFVWMTPGGGLDEGEEPWDGAAREVFEETGHRIHGGVPVWTREHAFEFEGAPIRQRETFFYVRVDRFVPATDRLEELERAYFRRFRWWKVREIQEAPEIFAPRRLGECLARLLRDGPPAQLEEVGR